MWQLHVTLDMRNDMVPVLHLFARAAAVAQINRGIADAVGEALVSSGYTFLVQASQIF
jgi:hypothetical protein